MGTQSPARSGSDAQVPRRTDDVPLSTTPNHAAGDDNEEDEEDNVRPAQPTAYEGLDPNKVSSSRQLS